MGESYTDNLKTEKKSIGFEYQYYFFLYELLGLPENGEIGLEEKDDVHIQIGKKLLLIQLKHTTQTNKEGLAINLMERDIDLWKTLHNWLGIIQNKSFGREAEIEQLKFLDNTYFQLVTNKSYSSRNKFFIKLNELKNNGIDVSNFINYLQILFDETKDSDDKNKENEIKNYIKELKEVSISVLEKFLKNIEIETSIDNIIQKIFKRIRHLKNVEDEHVEQVFNCIDSNLRRRNYEDIKNKKRIKITSEEFTKQYTRCFSIVRSPGLPERKRECYKFPDKFKEQIFIKQLIDIKDIKIDDDSEIIELTNHKLQIMNNMEGWIHEGDLMPQEKDKFDEDSFNQWKNYFKKVEYESEEINEDKSISVVEKDKKHIKLAKECLEKVRAIELKIRDYKFDSIWSNGQFYYLSDEKPRIGWIYNWAERYKT